MENEIISKIKYNTLINISIVFVMFLILLNVITIIDNESINKSNFKKTFTGYAIEETNNENEPENKKGEIYTESSYLFYYLILVVLIICIFILFLIFLVPRLKQLT